MNRKIAIALVAAAAAGSAFAENYSEYTVPFESTLTRAEVQADLARFQQAGVNPWSRAYSPLASFESTRSRAEVVSEYIAARDRVAAMTGEDSGSAYLARTGVQPSGVRVAQSATVAQ